jgi:Leucine-rich repeat (LRR) protein
LGLESCENLVFLNCSHNQLRSLQALNKLPKLERLFCAGNGLAHLEGIQHLSQITHLNLSDNELSDISFLQYLPNLQELDISNNLITDFSPVKKLRLQRLSFHGNPGAEALHPGAFSHLYKTKKKIKKFL